MIPMSLIFRQIVIIMGYVVVGFVSGKLGIIDPGQRKYLNTLLNKLILPFTILSSASMSASRETLSDVIFATAIMLGCFGLTTLVCLGLGKVFHWTKPLNAAISSLCTYPNAVFLGLPLCSALFGELGVLYAVSAMVSYNLLFFSVQAMLFTGKKFDPRNLLTVPMLSTVVLVIMLALGLHFPSPVQTVVSNIGAMITPMSLIIIGVMVSESDLAEVLREKSAYLVVLARNFLIPLCFMLALALMPLPQDAKLCVLVFVGCPCATLTSVYSMENDMEPVLCARTILLSTLAFAVSLPLLIIVGQSVLL